VHGKEREGTKLCSTKKIAHQGDFDYKNIYL
jgi:hypothetical protein